MVRTYYKNDTLKEGKGGVINWEVCLMEGEQLIKEIWYGRTTATYGYLAWKI